MELIARLITFFFKYLRN